MSNEISRFGFSNDILNQLISTIKKYKEVDRAIIYGSRARGDFDQGSDIDLTIDAPAMSDRDYARLWNELDALPIIYSMDVSHLQKITKEPLLNKIAEEGVDILLI